MRYRPPAAGRGVGGLGAAAAVAPEAKVEAEGGVLQSCKRPVTGAAVISKGFTANPNLVGFVSDWEGVGWHRRVCVGGSDLQKCLFCLNLYLPSRLVYRMHVLIVCVALLVYLKSLESIAGATVVFSLKRQSLVMASPFAYRYGVFLPRTNCVQTPIMAIRKNMNQ